MLSLCVYHTKLPAPVLSEKMLPAVTETKTVTAVGITKHGSAPRKDNHLENSLSQDFGGDHFILRGQEAIYLKTCWNVLICIWTPLSSFRPKVNNFILFFLCLPSFCFLFASAAFGTNTNQKPHQRCGYPPGLKVCRILQDTGKFIQILECLLHQSENTQPYQPMKLSNSYKKHTQRKIKAMLNHNRDWQPNDDASRKFLFTAVTCPKGKKFSWPVRNLPNVCAFESQVAALASQAPFSHSTLCALSCLKTIFLPSLPVPHWSCNCADIYFFSNRSAWKSNSENPFVPHWGFFLFVFVKLGIPNFYCHWQN